jgi:membrane protein
VTAIARLIEPYQDTLPLRTLRKMIAIGGYDRALALAAQAFVALVPALLVLTSLLAWSPSAAVIAGSLGLSRSAAATLADLLGSPASGSDKPLTVLGVALLVVSMFGFVRSLQRTYAAAWDLPSAGVRGYGHGLLASATLVAELAVLVLVAPLLAVLLGSALLTVAIHAATAILLWWPIQRVLLAGRVGWRALFPGALLTGVGQAVLVAASSVYVPIAVTRSTERYGILGLAAVLLSWLVVLGVLLVVSAVVGAELVRPARPPETEA